MSPVHTKAISQEYTPSILRQTLQSHVSHVLLAGLLFFLGTAISEPQLVADEPRVLNPNFRQAEQYNSAYLRQFVYSTSVSPNWIEKTDEFWYSFKSSDGTKYWRVNPEKGTRLPLFDHVKLAAQLSQLTRQAVEPSQLNLTQLEVSNKDDNLKFVVEKTRYEYALKTEALKSVGAVPTAVQTAAPGRTGQQQVQQEQKQDQDQQKDKQLDRQEQQQEQQQDQQLDQQQNRDEQRDEERTRGRGQQERGQQQGGNPSSQQSINDAHRNFAPDRKSYMFAKGHNLYFVQIPETSSAVSLPAKPEQPVTTNDNKSSDNKADESKKDIEKKDLEKVNIQKDAGEKQEVEKVEEQKKIDQGTTPSPVTPSTAVAQENNQDRTVQQETKQEGVKQEQIKQQDVKKEETTQEVVKQEVAKQEDTKQDTTKQLQDKQGKEESAMKADPKDAQKAADTSGSKPPKFDAKLDELAIQLTTDGVDKYSFAGRVTQRGASQEIKADTLTRPNVNWSKDSKSIYVMRSDRRDIKDLWVINSLATPRPTLETYPYSMPGEEKIRKTELFWFQAGQKSLTLVKQHWKDEFYSDFRFSDDSSHLRFLRRDRLLRNVEYCSLALANGETTCLFNEGFDKSTIAPKGVRWLENNQELIWWSERSGWGHFYLYDGNGKLKNPITSGAYFADRIVDLDEVNRILYFTALGREPGENLNYRHLYSVRLDGGDLKMLDPGNADHVSRLSPTKKYVVDNYSRVDLAPCSVLRNSNGVEIMKLDECDLSRLHQVGWKMPETFVVKAADGVTDLFGNMYKPFDFDSKKKYPIITYVYPGPQQEGTRHTFSATSGEQHLAQIGFIVIQVGHRGGTPGRSKAYAGYGYFNLRDYALPDKKAAIEQLAQRYSFIDVERVGIYGHSGGGFMTAAALMVPQYNDFFKAGFSTAGNHDNNIYNSSWSERWHGLREVPAEQVAKDSRSGTENRGQQRSVPSDLQAILEVGSEDFFHDYEMAADEDPAGFERRLWGDQEPMPLWLQEELQEKQRQAQRQQELKEEDKKEIDGKTKDVSKDVAKKGVESKAEQKSRFDITIPTNAELASNLKHHLFLVHGELDNNVHPANTLRLVDALIKANKKFDMLYLPATRHSFGSYQPYVTQRMFEFFAEHLMTDYRAPSSR